MGCRWCDSIDLKEVICFEQMPLTDQFVELSKVGSEFISNIEIMSCTKCGLVQNSNDFHFEEYYKEYEYSSGHSSFSQNFMEKFANSLLQIYEMEFSKSPSTIMEVGSGDGVQLKYFRDAHIEVLGVEPSTKLANFANSQGIRTLEHYFNDKTVSFLSNEPKFDITLSSFTFDHIPKPKEFLRNIWEISADESLLAFEIHDLEKINARGEWCLFEHEHMVYTSSRFWVDHLEEVGFKVVEINPIAENEVRANSMIIVAKKIASFVENPIKSKEPIIDVNKISVVKKKIENFINENNTSGVIGWGLGGRGVITSALLKNGNELECFFDSNFSGLGLCTPKTHVAIKGLDELATYKTRKVIVFSFGYLDEIKKTLLNNGFQEENIFSLREFF